MQNNVAHRKYYKSNTYTTDWIGVTLTDAAAQRIHQLINEDPNMLGLKVTIKKSGCAGFTYKIDKVCCSEENNLVYEHNGAKLFISANIMPFIDGTELDYIQEGLNFSFKFNNPQVQYSCGCGESFGI